MMLRRMLLGLVLISVPLSACSRRQPPADVTPTQQPDTGARGAGDGGQAQRDAAARAAAEAEAAERRAAEERTARVRAILEE
ncbi:MAG: hypothetical protein WD054_05900, partial [Gemmatimonadota bacterium]